MPKNQNRTLLLVLLLTLCAGCKKEEAPAPPPAAKPAQPAGAAKPAAPVQQQLSSSAKAVGGSFKKDPFKPFLAPQTAAPAAPVPGAARPGGPPPADLLPIQSFEVSKFKVAGIVAGLRENKALLVDPNGKGYVVQVGMQIGNANGRITRITPSTVEVVERSRESGGRAKSRTIVLTLAKKR